MGVRLFESRSATLSRSALACASYERKGHGRRWPWRGLVAAQLDRLAASLKLIPNSACRGSCPHALACTCRVPCEQAPRPQTPRWAAKFSHLFPPLASAQARSSSTTTTATTLARRSSRRQQQLPEYFVQHCRRGWGRLSPAAHVDLEQKIEYEAERASGDKYANSLRTSLETYTERERNELPKIGRAFFIIDG